MLNFKLVNGDVVMDGQNNITLVTSDDELIQCINENLTTNKTEWFLDDEVGFDRFGVLGQKYDEDNITNLLTEVIFQDERVDSIENLTFDFDRKNRKLSVKFEIIKTTGETVGGEAII